MTESPDISKFRCYLAVGTIVVKVDAYGFNFNSAKNNAIMRCGTRFPATTTRFLGGQAQVSPMARQAAISIDSLTANSFA